MKEKEKLSWSKLLDRTSSVEIRNEAKKLKNGIKIYSVPGPEQHQSRTDNIYNVYNTNLYEEYKVSAKTPDITNEKSVPRNESFWKRLKATICDPTLWSICAVLCLIGIIYGIVSVTNSNFRPLRRGLTGTDCPHKCDSNAECEFRSGIPTCVCMDGFFGNGTTCKDVDECSMEKNPCDTNAFCTNTIGNYTCTCLTGFTGNGELCKDINECSESSDCGPNSTCVNTNVDKCPSTYDCGPNAECRITDNRHTCVCSEGYFGDGETCQDIDECAETDICGVDCSCINTVGSFTCLCNKGPVPSDPVCEDIDECALENDCDPNAECFNTKCSYTCRCSDGYFGDGKTCQAKQAVLALKSGKDSKAVILRNNGHQRTPKFEFEENTFSHSCSVVWQDKIYLYGGEENRRQISRVDGCSLKLVGKLEFDHRSGDCIAAAGQVYLCFSYSDENRCRRSADPERNFELIAPSAYDHEWTRVAASNDVLFALGGWNNKVETFSFDSEKWTTQADYDFAKSIIDAPVLHRQNSFWVFGGETEAGSSSTIARYDLRTNQWTQAGSLNRRRTGHGAIEVQRLKRSKVKFSSTVELTSIFIIIGGQGEFLTEYCKINGNSTQCESREPSHKNFVYHPELFYVPRDFCS